MPKQPNIFSGILTDRHYQDLKRLRLRAKQLNEYLIKCEKCKLDVEQEKSASEGQLEVIEGMLREFFPNKPMD
jgi:hypothetical protein